MVPTMDEAAINSVLLGALANLIRTAKLYRDSAAISPMTRYNTGTELDAAILNAEGALELAMRKRSKHD